MGYKTTGNRRSKANSAVSSSTTVYNNPTGEGLGMNGVHVQSGQVLNSTPILAGQTEASNSTLTTIGKVANNMTITNLFVCDSSYNNLDDTAVDTQGGYIKLIGTNFLKAVKVYVGGVVQTNVTFVSSTEIRVQVPSAVTGTYSLMVFNGTSGAIWGTGLKFSGFPTFTQTNYNQSSLSVSVQLLATGDAPLTFSIFSGSLPSGLTMTSGGLISGTVIGSSVTNLTILCNDADLQTTQQNITLTISVTDNNFNTVSALMHADSINGNGNTTFIDSSVSSALVTSAGTPAQGSFNPYGATWSMLFNGSTDYLTQSNATAFVFGTGQYTMEGWFNFAVFTSAQVLMESRLTNTGNQIQLATDTSGNLLLVYGTTTILTGNTPMGTNTWYHLAVARDASNVTRMFLNGALIGTLNSDTNNISNATGFVIGRNITSPVYLNGYASNVRITKGSALYTAAFTPSTSSLTASANTSLLTCASNRILDKSTNAFAITLNGTPSIKRYNPFGNTNVPYIMNNELSLGSTLFNGSSDYLAAGYSGGLFQFGTGDYTIECWVNITSLAAVQILFDTRTDGTNPMVQLGLQTSGSIFVYVGATNVINSVALVPTNTWTHIAVTRTGTSMRLFVNGVQSGSTATDSSNFNSTTTGLTIARNGAAASNFMSGYMSNFRIVKGTSLYSATFIPPVAALTAISGTSVLTCQSTRGILTDASANAVTFTAGGTPRSSNRKPYGNSTYFTGSANYATFANNTNLALGTGDFTIEFWLKAAAQDTGVILNGRSAVGGVLLVTTGGAASSGATNVLRYAPTGTTSTAIVADNNWHHCAITRASGAVTLWVDGVASGTSTDSTNYSTTTGTWYVGSDDPAGSGAGQRLLTGNISNMRVVKGTAVYTAAFTPSTTPLTAISGTAFLGFQNGYLPTADNSSNGRTLTYTGTSTNTVVNPFQNAGTAVTTFGGSTYFNGSTDILTIPDASSTGLGGTNWTVEYWVYPTRASPAGTTFAKRANNSAFGPLLLIYNTDQTMIVYMSTNGTSWDLSSGSSMGACPINQWSHIVVTRTGNAISTYLNGVRGINITTTPGNIVNAQSFSLGADQGVTTQFQGYIADLRVTNGVSVYTAGSASITPPTAPLLPVPNTTLQMSGLNATIFDQAMQNNMWTNGATTTTTSKKFGSSAIQFNGSSGVQSALEASTNWSTQTGITWEAWVNITTLTGSTTTIHPLIGTSQASGDGYTVLYIYNNGKLALGIVGVNEMATAAGVISQNTWYHIAVVRSYTVSTNTAVNTLYINGNSVLSQQGGYWSNNVRPLWFGQGNGTFMVGQMDDIRISKSARYLANFTPPTNPFFDM